MSLKRWLAEPATKTMWVIFCFSILALVSTWALLSKPTSDNDQTFSFACGFRYGQNAVMLAWSPALIKPEEIVPVMQACEPYRKYASEHGFPAALERR